MSTPPTRLDDGGAAAAAQPPAAVTPAPPPPSPRPPLWAWVVLAIAVCAMSSGGVWFALLPLTPAMMRAAWRLLLTSLLQLPPFIYSYHRADGDARLRWVRSTPLLALTGVVLAVHFCAWSISVSLTSLTHSLLFVSTTPLVLIVYAAAKAGACALALAAATPPSGLPHRALAALQLLDPAKCRPPSPLETVGTAIGMVAAGVLAAEAGTHFDATSVTPDNDPTLAGDGAAFAGAVAMAFYLHTGSTLQRRMSLWLYVFPVTFVAGVAAAAASLAVERAASPDGLGAASLFGWLGSPDRFGITLCAAAGSGMLGHTGANAALGAGVNPLVISVVLLFEPVVGSVMGAAAGVQGWPGAASFGAGLLLMVGAAAVTMGDRGGGWDSPTLGCGGRWWCGRRRGLRHVQLEEGGEEEGPPPHAPCGTAVDGTTTYNVVCEDAVDATTTPWPAAAVGLREMESGVAFEDAFSKAPD